MHSKRQLLFAFTAFLLLSIKGFTQTNAAAGAASPSNYLDSIKAELKKDWPRNRIINLVFHGHSVPSGYFRTPVVNTFDSYPFLLLKELKTLYPDAVINVILTSKGGENAIDGEKRFDQDVLVHKPDVLFIDYVLNDLSSGLEKSRTAWEKMITRALAKNIKVILLTPTPHQSYNLLDTTNAYEPFARQVRELAAKYHVGLCDSYEAFRQKLKEGHNVTEYMSQVNHPNKEGHQLVADELVKWFK